MSGTLLTFLCCEDEVITIEETKTWFAKTESLALQRLADPEFLQHKDGGCVSPQYFLYGWEPSCRYWEMMECIACGTDPNDFRSSEVTVWLHFSRMRSEGFSFYILGDPAFGVRNRPQPSATVRARPS